MLFMVIEQFRPETLAGVRDRFSTRGRLLPDDVAYVASWIDASRLRCFQVMEAPDADRLQEWTARWSDLVGFEIVPVVTSQDFWAQPRVY